MAMIMLPPTNRTPRFPTQHRRLDVGSSMRPLTCVSTFSQLRREGFALFRIQQIRPPSVVEANQLRHPALLHFPPRRPALQSLERPGPDPSTPPRSRARPPP